VKAVWAKAVAWLASLSRKSGSAARAAAKLASKWWGAARSRLGPLGKATAAFCKKHGRVAFVELPRRLRERFRKLVPSRKTRLAVASGSAAAVLAVATFLLWPESEPALAKQPGKEYCEFLARPAARLYIDGKLVAEEIPPIHRVQLDVGKHHIRFVSPDSRAHETEIEVVDGKPVRWLMNFVDNRLSRGAATAEEARK
jgi:hypothetical protein